MPQGNNDNNANGAAFLVIGCLGAVAMMFMFLLTFLAFIMTILALCAWNQPRTFGKMVIQPHEARAFVERGIYGAGLVPAFLCLSDSFFNIGINFDAYAAHIVVGGYVLGSLGVEMLFADMKGGSDVVDPPASPPQQQILPPAKTTPRQTPPEPFRFASWDDEEAGR